MDGFKRAPSFIKTAREWGSPLKYMNFKLVRLYLEAPSKLCLFLSPFYDFTTRTENITHRESRVKKKKKKKKS
jgi:hypothetical protein